MPIFAYFCIGLFSVIFSVTLGDEQLSANYVLSYKIKGDYATFDIHAKTRGWVGLGFNTKESMIGADIVVAGVRSGENYAYDLHGVAHDLPPADSQQDYQIMHASQNETHTNVSIRRRLDTRDSEDMKLAVGSSIIVLWAYGKEAASNIYSFNYHTSQGHTNLTLS